MDKPPIFIKARKKGEKRFKFLSGNCLNHETNLRVHATSVLGEHAENVLSELRTENPEFEFKSVPTVR